MPYRLNEFNKVNMSDVTWYDIREEGWTSKQIVRVRNFKDLFIDGQLQEPGAKNDYVIRRVTKKFTTVKFSYRLKGHKTISVL